MANTAHLRKDPTEAQVKAGNYKKPRLRISGMEVAIENPEGTIRSGTDIDGHKWETRMIYPYGYIVGSKGVDGDPVDCYVGNSPESELVYVIHQAKAGEWSEFDEDKAMIHFDSWESAKRAYLLHYDDERFLASFTEMPIEEFKRKVMAVDGEMVKAMIDISGLSCGCANDHLEILSKAISEDKTDPWRPHENPFVAHLIEQFTDRGLLRTKEIRDEMSKWIAGEYFKRGRIEKPGMAPAWSEPELQLVKLYLQSIPPESWTLGDWDYLVSYLFQRYTPNAVTEAEWLTSKSVMMGKIQAAIGDVSQENAIAYIGALPHTIADAGATFALNKAAKTVMEYGVLKTADMIVSLTDSAKHAIKNVILDHMQKKLQGDNTATTGKLQQDLFDRFDQMNRDWRRIAITEAGEMANQGIISSLEPGEKVKRLEMYRGACDFCRKLNGKIFNVVSADDPNKNGYTDIWPGKTNYGRSASPMKRSGEGLVARLKEEMWWPAAGLQHPHCRGFWSRIEPPRDGDNPELSEWFAENFS